MKKIPVKAFVDLMHLPKRVALRKLYADFNVTQKADRKRCNKAWEMLNNALSERNSKTERGGESGVMADSGPSGDAKTSVQSGTTSEANGKKAYPA